MKPSFAIIGCGKVGCALARQLQEAGYPLAGLASRSLASAQAVAEQLNSDKYSDQSWEIAQTADVVFLTTPDGVIEEAASLLAEKQGLKPKAIVLHCSGSQPSTILEVVKPLGVSIGSLHPLQSFASRQIEGNPFADIIAAIEGEPEAVAVATEMAGALSATCLTIKTDAKTAYHAAAVVASNYLVAIQDLAFRLLSLAGIPETEAFSVLGPLIQGTVANIKRVGPAKALTGPIVRGDTETVRTHVAEIQRMAPELLGLYQSLGKHTVGIAETGGSIDRKKAGELLALLSGTGTI